MKNKNLYKFATFDIKEINPSVKEYLLKNAINFAEQHSKLSDNDKAIIFHARKYLLFKGQHVWIKKKQGLFDVTIGALMEQRFVNLLVIFLLYELQKKL